MKNVLILLCALTFAATASAGVPAPAVHGFVPNHGQWPAEVLFLNRADNLNIWVTTTGMVLDQYRIDGAVQTGHVLRVTWTSAVPQTAESVVDRTPSTTAVNFFSGSRGWHSDVPVFKDLRFKDVWPGIDLVYYTDAQNRLRYDFDVRPGAPLQEVGFKVDGDIGMQIEPQDVSLKTSLGAISMGDLYAYVLGRRSMNTQAVFTAQSNGVQFRVPQWNGSVPLRVDPVVYGTYVGGDADDAVVAVRTVSDGIIVGGWSSAIEFPDAVGAYKKDVLGARDAYVAKFSKDLKTVLAYTYYGGTKDDVLTALDVDPDGLVYFTGETVSDDLPTSVGAVGQIYKNDIDGFIAILSADLKTLRVSTYFGGNKADKPMGIAATVDGSVFVCGGTTSDQNFPTTLAHQATLGGQQDAFMLRLTNTGGSFVFCTYYGKSGIESFKAIALDNSGFPFVTGSTTSSDFETAPTPGRWASGRVPYDRSYNDGLTDAFLIKFFPDGTLSKRDDGTFSTFFGGRGEEEGRGIYIDNLGRPTLIGVTNSNNLPTTGGQQATPLGQQDIFLAVFTDDGRQLTSCTYFGGAGIDDVLGLAPDKYHNSSIAYGTTNSLDFPITGTGANEVRQGSTDGFLAAFNASSNRYVTLVGGNGDDQIISAATDDKGDYYYVMAGNSENLFVQPTSWMPQRPAGQSGYVGKWADGDVAVTAPAGGERWCSGATRTISWSKVAMRDDDRFTVEMTTDDGETWTKLADNLAGNSYQWKVPVPTSEAPYRIRVMSGRGHESWSSNFTVAEAPSVVEDPQAVTGCAGTSATLSVQAKGAELKYQWRRNGTNITNATNATYEIPSLAAASEGTYDCVITGVCQPSVTSRTARVTVSAATAITSQPKGDTVEEDKPITLTVVATGGSLTYQWMRNGEAISGATSATLSIAKATMADAGDYTCEVTGGCGSVTTETATIQVSPKTSVDEESNVAYAISVLGPTPAATTVRLQLQSPIAGMASVRLVDGQGAVVTALDQRMIDAGTSVIEIPVSMLASGSYGAEVVLNGHALRAMVLIAR